MSLPVCPSYISYTKLLTVNELRQAVHRQSRGGSVSNFSIGYLIDDSRVIHG
jgi:hypothetical protein